MIEPPPARRQRGDRGAHPVEDAGGVDRQGACAQPSSVSSATGATRTMPALLTSDVEPVEALLGVRDGRASPSGDGDVEAAGSARRGRRRAAVGVRLALGVEDVAEDDRGALLGEAAAVRRALAAGAAGDERRPAREPGVIRGPRSGRERGWRAVGARRAAEDAIDAPVRAVHVALPLVAGMSIRASAGDRAKRRQRDGGALGGQELRDQPRLRRVDRELRAARGGEPDEVQAARGPTGTVMPATRSGTPSSQWSSAGSRNGSVTLKPVANTIVSNVARRAVGEVDVWPSKRSMPARRGPGRGG